MSEVPQLREFIISLLRTLLAVADLWPPELSETRGAEPKMATIRVLSAEGEETIWPRAAAAEQATALKDWIESAADDGGMSKSREDSRT